jgi:hypothetical protein
MKVKSNRVQERTTIENIMKFLHDYAYVETLIIVTIYLVVGYIIDPNDICLLNGEISYILILLSVITLFHGFENGVLALGIIAGAIWIFYPSFEYTEFLIALMMTMLFSEFHYYWTKKIKAAEVIADYRGAKLDELSKAFYSLKISHDQLEKNYVVKPMSIRNSIEYIINSHQKIDNDTSEHEHTYEYYKNFLGLLEKSFNVHNAFIVYRQDDSSRKFLDAENTHIVWGKNTPETDKETIFENYLVDKAVNRNTPIYISDEAGDPSLSSKDDGKIIAVIPSIQNGTINEILVIEKMPFMSFNRENLTSISILLEYFSVEIRKRDTLLNNDELSIIPDEVYRFEYSRLKTLYKKYNVNSIVLVLRIDNELQATKIYEKIQKMLRSLDMVTMLKENNYYYIPLLFPLHDKAAALGYMNRLLNSLDEEKDKNFHYMTFDLSKTKLLNKYLREDYDS